MRILGIDPGLAIIGYGVIDVDNGNFRVVDYGVITTPKDETIPVRLAMIWDRVNLLISKFKPDHIAMEELFFTNNKTTGIIVSEARGVLLLAAVQSPAKLYEYTPMQIKQAITGYGKADKQQMQNMVRILLKLDAIPKPDDAADALAVAICHGQTSRFNEMFRMR
ncbi:MAG: crossover junction endodeoxyribonuclease RuvC [Clostridia bacterium]|nr:crossover junction endodeoxyribonuclease RuvC [Clostridia bacterium]